MHYKSHIFRTISIYTAILGLALNVSTISLAHADTTGITVDGSTCPVGLTTGPVIVSDTSISLLLATQASLLDRRIQSALTPLSS